MIIHYTSELEEALDMIEDLVAQGCSSETYSRDYDHCFISTYEDAMDLLVRYRPEKWRLTQVGMAPVEP